MDHSRSPRFSLAEWKRINEQSDFFDYSMDAVIAADQTFRITIWNSAAQESLGWTKRDAIGGPLTAFLPISIHPEELQPSCEKELNFAAGGGLPVQVLCRLQSFRDEGGAFVGCLMTLRDISELKKLRSDMESQQNTLLDAFDSDTEGIWIRDFKTGDVQCSSKIKSRIGADGLTGIALMEHMRGLVHPDDTAVMKSLLRCIERREPFFRIEYRLLTKDSGYIWAMNYGHIEYDEAGNPTKAFSMLSNLSEKKNLETALMQDIAERKEMERTLVALTEELQHKEHELLEILDCASIGSWIVNLNERTVLFSEQWQDYMNMRNLPHREQLEKTISAVHPDDRNLVLKYFNEGMSTSFPYSGIEYRLKNASGKYIWAYAKGKLSFGPQGKPDKFYGVCFDITDRKNNELELIEKNKLVVNFFTNVSHEFKTPLSIILLDVDLMRTMLTTAKYRNTEKVNRYISILRQNTYRLQRLIGNLLDITKLDAGFMEAHLQSDDIVALVGELAASVQEYAKNLKNIDVLYRHNCPECEMPLDSEKLERILLNLLSNSIKHTPKDGQISVNLDVRADHIVLSVRDNGEGIPEEKKDIIFNRFRQVNTSLTRDNEGCGIGLSLAKALVELMGGRIWFESTWGSGSEFFIEIPRNADRKLTSTMILDGGLIPSRKVEMEFSDIL